MTITPIYEVLLTNPNKDTSERTIGVVDNIKDAVRIVDFYSEKLPHVKCTYREII